jgi:uncharacterized protein GlcG (DUF336 family)
VKRRLRRKLIGGGVPILANGVVVGAVGVSGAVVEQDTACAQEGVEAAERAIHG